MAAETRSRGTRTYGVAFLVVVAMLLALSVAAFEKVFTDVVHVTLRTDRIGSQLQEQSDVKIRGLIVGEVRAITVTPDGAELDLALEPEAVSQIPAAVSARLLPKTLFGERYVDLVVPAGAAAAGPRIEGGDVIDQDRTTVAIELERVFEDLLPLLRAVQPEKLATTLGALATTLDGRGERLGENLVLVDRYFTRINPKLPTIQADISGLADLASTYAEAAPRLLRAMANLATTNTTIVEKQGELAAFFAGTAGFANTTAGFLERQQNRLIQVGRVNRPTLALFAKYSPQYPCVASGMVNWLPRIDEVWSNERFHITLEIVAQRDAYRPGTDEPRWGETRGPSCLTLDSPPFNQANPAPAPALDDGTESGPDAYHESPGLPSMFEGMAGAGVTPVDSGLAGTAEEQRVVAAMLGAEGGPSSMTTLLAGPMLRGSVVSTA